MPEPKRGWIDGEEVWGYVPGTNHRAHGWVANANGLMDGYVRIYLGKGDNRVQVVHVAEHEDPRRQDAQKK